MEYFQGIREESFPGGQYLQEFGAQFPRQGFVGNLKVKHGTPHAFPFQFFRADKTLVVAVPQHFIVVQVTGIKCFEGGVDPIFQAESRGIPVAYLRALDADFLKIDAALAGGRPDDPLDLAIIASLVRIARVTGKSIIAECVEDPLTLAMLAECGVDYAQGHAIGYPRPELPLPSPPPTLEADDIGAVA